MTNGQTVLKKQPPINNTINNTINITIYTPIPPYLYRQLSLIIATYLKAFLWLFLWAIFAGQALASDSFRVISQNMHRLFDDVDNGRKFETVLSTKEFRKKSTLAAQKFIVDFELPDIMALQEVENINTLNQIIHHIQQTSGARYKAVLKEGNDVSGMDIGFLIKSEYQIKSVKQLFKKNTLVSSHSRGKSPLFSRPPLLIEVCKQSNCITVLNLHLRSMRGMRSKSKGHRVRTKRLQQASAIARWIDQYQRTHSEQSLMVLGDLNALFPPDRYIDVVGTIIGKPDNRNTQLSSQDLIQNDLIDLTQLIPHKKRYSYIYKKKKQVIDYMLISHQFKPRLKHIRFSQIDYRFSDHAGLIADFSW